MAVVKNNKTTKTTKKVVVTPSNNAELNALVGIKAKVEFLIKNWFTEKFYEEFGELIQSNVSKCIGCSLQSVAVYWDVEEVKNVIQAWKVGEAKKIRANSTGVTTNSTGVTTNSILDDEPQRTNKIVSYTTESSTKSLKELYFELGEAHGELEAIESKIELLETEIQQKRLK